MHLTVEFLGEIQNDKVDLIKAIMNELDFRKFTLSLTNIGHFKRCDGNIYWLGIKDNDTLFHINNKLRQGLIEKGFDIENREYKPHITIGRKVKLKDNVQTNELDEMVDKIEIGIAKVDLMKSEFINGKLMYSVVYTRRLEE